MLKRGQAATEFLMTYGWTILVIMVVIGMLFSLGVFDIKVPNDCFSPDPYTCQDVKLKDTTLTLLISASGIDRSSDENKVVTPIKVNGVDCNVVGDGILKLASDAALQVMCNLPSAIESGDKFEGIMNLQYRKYGGNVHSISGRFSGIAE